METIKNYLETMFLQLPDNFEVRKAKQELSTMMEDKYNALIEEGMSEEEASSTVIAEFGNLSEIAGELGIEEAVKNRQNRPDAREVTPEEAKDFLSDAAVRAQQKALAVALMICSPIGSILLSGISQMLPGGNRVLNPLGPVIMFGMVAAGIILLVGGTARMEKWSFLKREACMISYENLGTIDEEFAALREHLSWSRAIGIGLCVCSVIPVILFDDVIDSVLGTDSIGGELGSTGMFLCIAVGVFLIIRSSLIGSSYQFLLKLNEAGTMGASFYESQKAVPTFEDPMMQSVMNVYWKTVLCLYLIWSFLSFSWYITWIIWPVAAIIHRLLVSFYGTKEAA